MLNPEEIDQINKRIAELTKQLASQGGVLEAPAAGADVGEVANRLMLAVSCATLSAWHASNEFWEVHDDIPEEPAERLDLLIRAVNRHLEEARELLHKLLKQIGVL